jgi:hypothetical protein
MTTRKTVSPAFTKAREFITRYTHMEPEDADIVAVWTIGTWCFSPACQWPATFPYLYVTGEPGAGKSVLCQDAIGSICRNWKSATGATGPTLFRLLGTYDEETGEIENHAPTLFMDEIDATFSGQKDEPLRLSLNVGYKRGTTIPRSAGKSSIDFPIYGPKMMAGIPNGHLPETVTQRSIRIDLKRLSSDDLEAAGVEEFYVFDVEDEAAELQQQLSDWAKDHSMVLRDYRPKSKPKGLTARQWEIGRTMIQLAHALGNEDQITRSLVTVLGRNPVQGKVSLYKSISSLFADMDHETPEHADRVTSRQVLDRLSRDAVHVPGQSLKGLSAVLAEDGIGPEMIRLRDGHPGELENGSPTQRGYYRHNFDDAFLRYVEDED